MNRHVTLREFQTLPDPERYRVISWAEAVQDADPHHRPVREVVLTDATGTHGDLQVLRLDERGQPYLDPEQPNQVATEWRRGVTFPRFPIEVLP